ncbi:MAG TPA: hypothetical protein VJB66_04000 [Candidatus Nanoarchaeia archaeon]|nr:hypothetical protein [Candidatus Nanoarchaeia archaeon]
MVLDIYEIKECPDCGSSEIIYNEKKHHVICKDCNVIYEPLTPKEEETYLGYSKSEAKPHKSSKVKASKLEKTPRSSKTPKVKIKTAEPKVRRRRPRDDDQYV